jgi:hypothetical protein
VPSGTFAFIALLLLPENADYDDAWIWKQILRVLCERMEILISRIFKAFCDN